MQLSPIALEVFGVIVAANPHGGDKVWNFVSELRYEQAAGAKVMHYAQASDYELNGHDVMAVARALNMRIPARIGADYMRQRPRMHGRTDVVAAPSPAECTAATSA